MTYRPMLAVFFALAIFRGVLSDESDGQSGAANVQLAVPSLDIPFTLAATQILVDDVYVNGQGPFRFLLDTGGMGGGRVDASLARKLSLEKKGEVLAGDGTSRQAKAMPAYELQSVKIGDLAWENVHVLSRDYNEAMAQKVRGPIDGILGFGLFEQFLTTIDYAKRSIRVERGSLPEPNGGDVLSMDHDGVPGIEILIAGQPHRARLDTGSMGDIMISTAIAESLEFSAKPKIVGRGATLTGSFSISRAPLNGTVAIGAFTLQNPELTIGGPVQGVNIGGRVLRDFVVTYDQRNRRVRLTPNPVPRLADPAGTPRPETGATSGPMELDP